MGKQSTRWFRNGPLDIEILRSGVLLSAHEPRHVQDGDDEINEALNSLAIALTTHGDIVYRAAGLDTLARLAPGVAGQALLTGGPAANVLWGAPQPAAHAPTHEPDGTDTISLLLLIDPAADHSASGYVKFCTVGENVDPGDVLYQKSDEKWWKADADAEATMPGAALATATILADAEGYLLFYGVYRDDSWAWTPGAILYVSVTPGPPTDEAPDGAGDQVQVFGLAIGPSPCNYALVNPSYELVERS